jgi:hypothetical protein
MATHYYGLFLSFTNTHATKWHPTTSTGPFAVLTRGAFDTEREALLWARSKGIHPNTCEVRRIEW